MAKRPTPVSEAEIRQQAEKVAAAFEPLILEARRVAHTVATGSHGRRRAGPGETFWQHRAYAFGDPVSAIDWRQSARAADRLYVRQNEWEAAAAVWIWRDPSRSLDYASAKEFPTKRRRADILAVALASLLAEAGERIGLARGEPRSFHGRNADIRFLEELGVDAFDDDASTPPAIPVAAHASVVYVSDFLTDLDAVASAAGRCAGLGANGVFLQVFDPAEETFPFGGRTEFRDMESARRLTIGDAASLRERYVRAFAAHRDELESIANRLNWTYVRHRTDAPAETALFDVVAALSQDGRRRR